MKVRLAIAVLGWVVLCAAGPPAANDFRFAIIGDRTGEHVPGVYEAVWREVDQFHPNFVINVGDVIEGGNDATAEQQWQMAKAIWRRYNYPLYFTPGNHDIWSEASQKIYEKYTGHPRFYSFNYGDAHFTVLDNSRTQNLGDDQIQFLEKDLEANRSSDPKFVFFHQPTLWLIPLKFQSDFALHRILLKYHVTAVFSGHTHQFACMEKDGILYVCVGSSGGHMRGHSGSDAFAQGWFYHHVRATVRGSRTELMVKEVDAPLGKGRTFDVRDRLSKGR